MIHVADFTLWEKALMLILMRSISKVKFSLYSLLFGPFFSSFVVVMPFYPLFNTLAETAQFCFPYNFFSSIFMSDFHL